MCELSRKTSMLYIYIGSYYRCNVVIAYLYCVSPAVSPCMFTIHVTWIRSSSSSRNSMQYGYVLYEPHQQGHSHFVFTLAILSRHFFFRVLDQSTAYCTIRILPTLPSDVPMVILNNTWHFMQYLYWILHY